METDFIVIGSGLAGLTSSLVLKEHGSVLLISKSQLDNCATNLAQGGIAAVVTEEDSFEAHIKDTLIAGCFHNDKKAVRLVVQNAPSAIVWLGKNGVRFERKNSQLTPTREAAHSHHRVLHASDFTGREIERALISKVRQSKNIEIWENCFVSKLLVEKGVCFGVSVLPADRNFLARPDLIGNTIQDRFYGSSILDRHLTRSCHPYIMNLFSRSVILATGGLGQLFQWTTNPKIATSDGIALAQRAGAKLKDMEFIQFHPTALKDGESPLFLLSEALRGEGAYLTKSEIRNPKSEKEKDGERFMGDYDKRMELAPRDIVARAIFAEQQKGYSIFLDIRHKGKNCLQERFPNIYKELRNRGFDLAKDLIPVTPAAHYSCGGIVTDLYGRTNIKNLFAFGEVACTGVHGANRLASNSLLEAVVFPLRLKECISELPKNIDTQLCHSELVSESIKEKIEMLKRVQHDKVYDNIKKQLKRLMWEKVGIVRRSKELKEAKVQIKKWEKELDSIDDMSRELLEVKNMLLVARLITEAAIKRKESLGAHFKNPD